MENAIDWLPFVGATFFVTVFWKKRSLKLFFFLAAQRPVYDQCLRLLDSFPPPHASLACFTVTTAFYIAWAYWYEVAYDFLTAASTHSDLGESNSNTEKIRPPVSRGSPPLRGQDLV